MSLVVLLPDLPELLVEQAIIGEEAMTIVARLTTPAMPCPACSQLARRIHSGTRRTLYDVPVGGRMVRLSLQVCRFFCLTPTCPRKTFTEQVSALAAPYARRTTRVQDALRRIGFALEGEAGARLAGHLGMACSPDTLVRLLRQSVLPSLPTPRLWAYGLTALVAAALGALKARYTRKDVVRSSLEFLTIVTAGTLAGVVISLLHAV